jgi:CheY-like chemotaxis protein
MEKTTILWADDEIDLLKPHILFLNSKGYDIITALSGDEAIDIVRENNTLSAVLLDENMPGISGLEALTKIKQLKTDLPVIMITKSEEEHIMEDAIGNQIADYLIKPVNSSQILLSLKRILDSKQLVTEKTAQNYQQEFRQIAMELYDVNDYESWVNLYKKLVYWELELAKSGDTGMDEILAMQKRDANNDWVKFIEKNFVNFLKKPDAKTPAMSHTVINKKLMPVIDKDIPTFLILIDNFRYDQWKMVQSQLTDYFNIISEDTYLTILPTTTHYARNSFFAGMLPSEIERLYPNLWVNEEEDEGKNIYEEEFINKQMQRLGYKEKITYTKVTNLQAGKNLADTVSNLMSNKFNVIVYNFVDMLSHVRTEMNVMKELAEDEAAYRSITASWFEHSPLFEAIKKIAQKKVRIIITTDHGSIRVKNPVKIIGDKNTSTNLRYKQGKNLSYNANDLFGVKNPADVFLPKQNMSTSWVFAKGDDFMVYPNNYNYHVNFYNDSFQHGGISLEEMIVPFIVLETK